jgi:hypothetical protein
MSIPHGEHCLADTRLLRRSHCFHIELCRVCETFTATLLHLALRGRKSVRKGTDDQRVGGVAGLTTRGAYLLRHLPLQGIIITRYVAINLNNRVSERLNGGLESGEDGRLEIQHLALLGDVRRESEVVRCRDCVHLCEETVLVRPRSRGCGRLDVAHVDGLACQLLGACADVQRDPVPRTLLTPLVDTHRLLACCSAHGKEALAHL